MKFPSCRLNCFTFSSLTFWRASERPAAVISPLTRKASTSFMPRVPCENWCMQPTSDLVAPVCEKPSSPSLLAYGGAAIALGAVVLHLMGFISQDTYLSRQDVDQGPFGKSADELVILGFFSLARVLVNGVVYFDLSLILWPALIAVALIAFGVFVILLMESSRSRLASWVRRKVVPVIESPKWSARIGVAFGAATTSVVSTIALLGVFYVAMLLVLALPVIIGVSDGRTRADETSAYVAANCTRAARIACVSLIKDGVEVARGYMIDSSERFVALYDVNQGGPRVLAREKMEIKRVLASVRP